MARHLIVDDMQVRHEGFKKILRGELLDHADNVVEAVNWVRERYILAEPVEHYHTIFLDHDIERGFDQRDVVHFVNWIVDHDFIRPTMLAHGTRFFIHSHSDPGAINMMSKLQAAGFWVRWRKFGQ